MNVHFILTKGQLHPQYKRAIESAAVHRRPITLWHYDELPDINSLKNYNQVTCRKFFLPDWLKGQLGCVIYDYMAYKIGYEEGGLLLGLDTLSVRNAFDLFDEHPGSDIILSRDLPDDQTCQHPFNNIFLCKGGSSIMKDVMDKAQYRIMGGDMAWGDTGPALLTQYVGLYYPKVTGCSFPALCGWEGRTIWKFYLGFEKPDPKTRVIHLFSSAYPELFWRGDVRAFVQRYPWIQAPSQFVNPNIYALP